jgi:hypothetical protein
MLTVTYGNLYHIRIEWKPLMLVEKDGGLVQGQRRETGCPLRCAWRGSDHFADRRWPLAYQYMQDIAATRALFPWLQAATDERPADGTTISNAPPPGLQRLPTLQRPAVGGNLSQFVYVDQSSMVRLVLPFQTVSHGYAPLRAWCHDMSACT